MQILLVEDDADAAGHIAQGLRDAGYQVQHCADGRTAQAALAGYEGTLGLLETACNFV